METVACNCKNCDTTIGHFVNLWTQVGKRYFSPIVDPDSDDSLALRSEGGIRVGEAGTLVEACQLQDIVCDHCDSVLGLMCINTPVNHVLHKGQILLRLVSVELITDEGEEVDFTVKRLLDLKQPPRVQAAAKSSDSSHHSRENFNSSAFPEAIDLLQLQADLKGQRGDINRIDSNGFKIISALDKRMVSMETEARKLRDTLGEYTRGISSLPENLSSLKSDLGKVQRALQDQGPLAHLEERLGSVTTTLEETQNGMATLAEQFRQDLADMGSELFRNKQEIEDMKSANRVSVSAQNHANDMAMLRAEVTQLRRQLDNVRSENAERVQTPFPSRELDILTSSIAKIGNRASQVETLQMELEILKGRVERAEVASRKTSEVWRPSYLTDLRDLPPYNGISTRRKRDSSGMETPTGFESNSKRPAFETNSSDPSNNTYDTSSDWPDNSPRPPSRGVPVENRISHNKVKLTKAGKVDKRSMRSRKSLQI